MAVVATSRPEIGRSEWLTELYHANAGAVYAYCQRFLNNTEDAADATHEVFLRALSSLQASPQSRQARSWLITVAQNYCLDLVRRRRRLQSALTTLAGDADHRPDSEGEVVNRGFVQAVLAQLGERERQALWQSAVERRPLVEIAGYLGLSYVAAAQVVHRARKHALLVAGKIAVILGLVGANASRRRALALNWAQSVAAMAIVPLVVAIATPSATARGADFPRLPASHAAAITAVHHPVGISPAAATASSNQAAAASGGGLPSRTLHSTVRSIADSTVGRIRQTIVELMSPLPQQVAIPVPAALPALSLPAPPSLPPTPRVSAL